MTYQAQRRQIQPGLYEYIVMCHLNERRGMGRCQTNEVRHVPALTVAKKRALKDALERSSDEQR